MPKVADSLQRADGLSGKTLLFDCFAEQEALWHTLVKVVRSLHCE